MPDPYGARLSPNRQQNCISSPFPRARSEHGYGASQYTTDLSKCNPKVQSIRITTSIYTKLCALGIPEAAFQDEIYCCLNHELHNLPILSEYSHTKDGRVDFYIYKKKWCIEVLQCGNKAELAKHIARFATGGKYRAWNIFEVTLFSTSAPCLCLRRWKLKVISAPPSESLD